MYIWGETQESRALFLCGHRSPRPVTIPGVFAPCSKTFSGSAGGLVLPGQTQRKACYGYSCKTEGVVLTDARYSAANPSATADG